jgi:hypothetical protein
MKKKADNYGPVPITRAQMTSRKLKSWAPAKHVRIPFLSDLERYTGDEEAAYAVYLAMAERQKATT